MKEGNQLHYSKDYYTKAKERIDKLQNEFTEDNTPFTNSDALQEAEQNDPGFEKIMARIRKMEQQTMHVVNPEKLTSFFQLMDMAKELAEYCEMNIDIKTSKSLYGVLKLQSGYIMMNKDTDVRIREILNELTLKSEQFSIAALEGIFEMDYWFDLFDVIEK